VGPTVPPGRRLDAQSRRSAHRAYSQSTPRSLPTAQWTSRRDFALVARSSNINAPAHLRQLALTAWDLAQDPSLVHLNTEGTRMLSDSGATDHQVSPLLHEVSGPASGPRGAHESASLRRPRRGLVQLRRPGLRRPARRHDRRVPAPTHARSAQGCQGRRRECARESVMNDIEQSQEHSSA